MTLLIHYSDFTEFCIAVELNLTRINRERLYATTRWVRGMPETGVFVECSFGTYDELHRFERFMGSVFQPGEEAEKISAAVDALHESICRFAKDNRLVVHPGRVQLWTETMGTGGRK